MSEKKFWSKIRNNRIYLALTGIIGAVLLFLLVLYLAVPSYSFAEIEPFNGDFIYNPYSDIKRINYIDFRSESIENQGIKVCEYGYALSGTRYLCVGCESKRKIDYPFLQSIHYKQFNIDKLNKKCRIAAPAHPTKGFKKGEMTRLDHYRVMEALSENDNSLYYWDIALSNGHRVNIIATGKNYATACIGENDAESVCNSLETGNSYAVKYNGNLLTPESVTLTISYASYSLTNSEVYIQKTTGETFMRTNRQTNIITKSEFPYFKFYFVSSSFERITDYDKTVSITCTMGKGSQTWNLDVSKESGYVKYLIKIH